MSANESKQVILVRKDLNMGPGKIAAQTAHASVMALLDRVKGNFIPFMLGGGYHARLELSEAETKWLEGSQTKVALWVDNLQELLDYHKKAKEKGLPCSLVEDEGRTEISPGFTTVAIGPANKNEIDELTGDLKLLKRL